MMGSKLPMSMLGKIWDLADQDKDGSLDRLGVFIPTFLIQGVFFNWPPLFSTEKKIGQRANQSFME